jgi:hypothetical protein
MGEAHWRRINGGFGPETSPAFPRQLRGGLRQVRFQTPGLHSGFFNLFPLRERGRCKGLRWKLKLPGRPATRRK